MAQKLAGMAASSGVLGQHDLLSYPLAPREMLWAHKMVHHPRPVCPGVMARSPPGGTGTIPAQRNKAGLAGCVWRALGFEGTAATPRVSCMAAPLALMLRPLLLDSCDYITSTPCPAGSQGQVLSALFLERCPQTVLECLFLLTGQPGDSGGEERKVGG